MRVFDHYESKPVVPATAPPSLRYPVPLAANYFAEKVTLVTTEAEAWAMADLARQEPLCLIGLDTEYRYDRPGVPVNAHNTAYDPRSIRPLLLSLALIEPAAGVRGELGSLPFVFDVRQAQVRAALTEVLRLPIPFVGHTLTTDLYCLWQLGLPEPEVLWDTWVFSRAAELGRHHKNYQRPRALDQADEAIASKQRAEDKEKRHSLIANCQRYGVTHRFAVDKKRLQESFLDHPVHAPFSTEQIEYAAEDAVAAAGLYPHQVLSANQTGVLQYFIAVEMPWVRTNARIGWNGVRVDARQCQRVRDVRARHLATLQPQLAAYGIANAHSFPQLQSFFERAGLLELFRRRGKLSFDKDSLDAFAGRHTVIDLVRAFRKVRQLASDKLLTGVFVGADGRVHPDHCQLGADTGRQSCRWPNVAGLGKVFRPLVIPEPGHGIGEADLSQIEVGLAGAVYHDYDLVNMCNSGDVYSGMAQRFYYDQLPLEIRDLPSLDFKKLKQYAWMRTRMKRCTLGILYGLTPHGLAAYLNITTAEAVELQRRFLGMFPALAQALSEVPRFAERRGYAQTRLGLRRYRARKGRITVWEQNWMTNHPVQGSAAVVFKAAGNRLDRLYQAYDALLIVPLHDAYVFEAPLEVLEEVGALTGRVLCEAVQEFFPSLRPRADVNVVQPHCWNKDGRADSLDCWIEDPTFALP
jgi:DNA polymerase-1